MHLKQLKAGTQRDIYTPTFVAVPFTTAERGKQPKCPSMGAWKQNVVHTHTHAHTRTHTNTVEHGSALQRKGTLARGATWMHLKDTVVRETNQPQKDHSCVIPSQEAPGAVTFMETDSRRCCQGRGRGARLGSYGTTRAAFQFCEMKTGWSHHDVQVLTAEPYTETRLGQYILWYTYVIPTFRNVPLRTRVWKFWNR